MQWLKRRRQARLAARQTLDVAARSLLVTLCMLIALDFAERRDHLRAGVWLAVAVLLGFPENEVRHLTSNPRRLLSVGALLMALVDFDLAEPL